MSDEVIAIASDHGGYDLKEILKTELEHLGYAILDLGCYNKDSVDYPDYADKMAAALLNKSAERGVLICGSGIGISIAANRHRHVRAALVHDGLTSQLSRHHNNANVIVLGGRTTGVDVAKDCLKIFLETDFDGGRHQRRIELMS
ncbi:MAG: ribose 5-phosphate isomerase B [Alphaproteobacteria bacterium]|nr:ribose 5-phosphate isomerase B [Alphaproteobacteria bacterium]HPF46413.1 ribose 5-phosphate isomerase B [Emcibacteraceae bacterium]HRW30244.1 ribose 5-phosphate isomerase B [Emcibacteraceae bacterium]